MTEHDFFIRVREMVDNPPCFLSQSTPYSNGYRDAYINAYAAIKEMADEVVTCGMTFRYVLWENEGADNPGSILDKLGNRHDIKFNPPKDDGHKGNYYAHLPYLGLIVSKNGQTIEEWLKDENEIWKGKVQILPF